MAYSRDIQITLSGDGRHDREHIKRYLTTAWPEVEVVGADWYHLAFSFASGGVGDLRLYLDGSQVKIGLDGHLFDDSPVPHLHRSGQPLILGALEGIGNAFEGSLSEVAVWGRVLTHEEILWLYRNSLKQLETDPP